MTKLLAVFNKKFQIIRIYSIPVFLDLRWIIVFALLVWLIARSVPNSIGASESTILLLSILMVFTFIVCLLLHEWAHAYIAKKAGLNILEILLLPFGGIQRAIREPDSSKMEIRIAIAGPVASLAIAFLFLCLFVWSNYLNLILLSPFLFSLFLLNLLVAVFNLFPGYPLDGGRVIRSMYWQRSGDWNGSTILASRFGEVIAIVLSVFGLFTAIYLRDFLVGFWSLIVGIVLFDSARIIIKQVRQIEFLTVNQIMEPPVLVYPENTLAEFIGKTVSQFGLDVYPVSRERRLLGFLLLTDVYQKFPQDSWQQFRVSDAMREIEDENLIESNSYLPLALDILNQNRIGVLAVLNQKHEVIGVLRRGKIRIPTF